MMQYLLSPLDNVLAKPGCEWLTLKHDVGFDSSTCMKEVLEIDMTS